MTTNFSDVILKGLATFLTMICQVDTVFSAIVVSGYLVDIIIIDLETVLGK